MKKIWQRIEAYFAKHPEFDLKLRPGATEKAIAAAEKKLKVQFPRDFRESLALHDGQEDDAYVLWLPHGVRLGSLASLTRCWADDRGYYDADVNEERLEDFDTKKKVRQVLLHPAHVPIAGSRHWDYGRLMLDYLPGPKGKVGQVIAREDIDMIFVADSWETFLGQLATGLERGKVKPSNQ